MATVPDLAARAAVAGVERRPDSDNLRRHWTEEDALGIVSADRKTDECYQSNQVEQSIQA